MSQEWSLTPAAAAPPQVKGKGMIWTGVILLVVGLLLFIAGIVGVVVSAASLASAFGAPVSTPTTVNRTLEKGTTYAVYERTTPGSGTGTSDDPLLAGVDVADITVTGPGGIVVGVQDPGNMTQTFTNEGATYFAVATFDAPANGDYQIAIATEGARVIVAPSFTAFGRSVAWAAAIGLGALIGLIGLILLIIGLVRRSSSKKAAAQAAAGFGAYGATAYQQPAAPQPTAYQQPAAPAPPAAAPPVADGPVAPVTPEPVAPQPVAPPAAPQPVAPVSPPAGWYADPGRPGGQRYWDGSAWTEHTA